MALQQAYADTPAAKLARTAPSWMKESFEDPVSNIKGSKGRPLKRQKPVNVNLPPPRSPNGPGQFDLEGVGSGYPVFLSREDTGDGNQIRSIKSTGGGAAVLKEAEESDKELSLRSIKAKSDTPITVGASSDGESIEVGGNGVSGTATIPMGGVVSVQDGIVVAISPPAPGGSGRLTMTVCGDDQQTLLEWDQGVILTDSPNGINFDVGNVCQTDTEGS